LDPSKWLCRKDKLPLAKLISQPFPLNIDPNYPHTVGMFVAHRII
jgi:hypothetical protein